MRATPQATIQQRPHSWLEAQRRARTGQGGRTSRHTHRLVSAVSMPTVVGTVPVINLPAKDLRQRTREWVGTRGVSAATSRAKGARAKGAQSHISVRTNRESRANCAHKLVQLEGALWQAVYAGVDASVQAGSVDGDMLRPRAAPQRKVLDTELEGAIRGQGFDARASGLAGPSSCRAAQKAGRTIPRMRAQGDQVGQPVELRRQRPREARRLHVPAARNPPKRSRVRVQGVRAG